jgi:hypothetical protein
MLMIYFDIEELVHKEVALGGQRVQSAYYCYRDVLRRLRESVQTLRPNISRRRNWRLHYDNAPFHTSFLTRECLTKTNMAVARTHPAVLFPQLRIN